MNWNNLQLNKCPNCDKDFVFGLATYPSKEYGQVLTHPCGFKISERRYSQIVSNQVNDSLLKEWELEQL